MAAKKSLPPSKRRPHGSRAPSRRVPPPPPSRKQTMEVDASWLLPDEAPARSRRPPQRETIPVKLEWLEAEERKSRRPRPVPPPLPTAVQKPRRVHPPPLPREEPPESRPSSRARHSRRPKKR